MEKKRNIYQIPISADILAGQHESFFREAPVLPEQFFTPAGINQPEKRLMEAVLGDALDCFQKGKRSNVSAHIRKLAEEAKAWFLSDESNWPFSFIAICHALDLNPDNIRKQIESDEWHYEKARGGTRDNHVYIVHLTVAQKVSRRLGREKELKAILRVAPEQVIAVLRSLQKRKDWKEVYNLVFSFLFFHLVNPPQSVSRVAWYLRCGQTYVHEKLREKFSVAIYERDPYFREALADIAAQCGMNMQALATLLFRLQEV